MLDHGQGCIQKIGKDGSFKVKTNDFFVASKLDGNKVLEPHLDDGYRNNSGCSEQFEERSTDASCSQQLEESVCSPEVESEIGYSKMIIELETDSNLGKFEEPT